VGLAAWKHAQTLYSGLQAPEVESSMLFGVGSIGVIVLLNRRPCRKWYRLRPV
jgi:hypothetical protein